MSHEQLKLEKQVCFPVYTASRLITREYQPYLKKLKITYPQYLVLLVLWENDDQPVNEIAGKLCLSTNTVTPLLQRMEEQRLLRRKRSSDDERKVIISLSSKGRKMKNAAASVPGKLVQRLKSENLSIDDLKDIRDKLNILIKVLKETN